MEAEIHVDAEGHETLRLPRAIVEGASRVAALESELAALRRQLTDAPTSARVKLGLDAAAREQIAEARASAEADRASGQASLKASMDQVADIGTRLIDAVNALTKAVASVTPVFNVPPAPLTPFVIEAKAGDLKLTNVLTIPPRKIVLEGPDGTFEGRAE